MKKFTQAALAALFIAPPALFAQTLAVDSIEINTLKAKVYSDGGIWEMETWDDSTYKPLLFADGIWIGGLDGLNLNLSSQLYRQDSLEFKPGPISNDPNVFTKYNQVYKVNLQTLTDFKNKVTVGIPSQIANWPAHGDTTQGEAYYLAPFVDVNQDGHYVPADGDYPKIKGDEAIYTIFNDINDRYYFGGMGVEVHCMLYGYKTGGIEDSILFKEFRVINRSSTSYVNSYFSIFADFDLGNARDDIMGTNISANSIFTYNGDSDDEGPSGFGTKLATCGIRMIKGPPADYFNGFDDDKDGCLDAVRDANGNCIPENQVTGIREQILLSGSMYYNNFSGAQGNPNVPTDYYSYMKSDWPGGRELIIENPSGLLNVLNGDGFVQNNVGIQTTFAYPGNSFDTSGSYSPVSPVNWFASPSNLADQRMLANAGPFTIGAGQEFDVTYAFIWSRKQDTAHGYNVINNKLAYLDTLYRNQPSRYVSISKYHQQENYRVAYNQRDNSWWILNEGKDKLDFKLYNTSSQFLSTFSVQANSSQLINLDKLSSGVYITVNEKSGTSHKLIK